jgi:ATP-dependent DNA helicase PIF1
MSSPARVPDAYTLTEEQQAVSDAILAGRQFTFLTGGPGMGKSHLVRALRFVFQQHKISAAFTAMTGVAASNISGCTMHSYFGIGLAEGTREKLAKQVYNSEDASERIRTTSVVLIDEVSMMSAELFEKIEYVCRVVREDDRPFGGLQLILVGDFYQLPPTFMPKEDKDGKRERGDVRLLFECDLWRDLFPKENQAILTKVFRQHEPELIALLNECRIAKVSLTGLETVKKCLRKLEPRNGVEPTMLFPRRYNVHQENENKLVVLDGPVWNSTSNDELVKMSKERLDSLCQAPEVLKLKRGAQVMLLKNNKDLDLHNGSRGVVVELGNQATNDECFVTVRFLDGCTHTFRRHAFDYKGAGGRLEAVRHQYPFALAYAMTIHKAQGSSLDYVCIDLDGCFAYGQAYVALSRACTLEGLQIRGFDRTRVKTDPLVVKYFDDIVSDTEVLQWMVAKEGKSVDDAREEYRASKRVKKEA